MTGPVQGQVLVGFRQRLEESTAVPDGLAADLVELAGRDRVPNADVFLAAIKAKVGATEA